MGAEGQPPEGDKRGRLSPPPPKSWNRVIWWRALTTLRPGPFKLLHYYLWRAEPKTSVCKVGQRAIVRDTGIDGDSIARWNAELRKGKWIKMKGQDHYGTLRIEVRDGRGRKAKGDPENRIAGKPDRVDPENRIAAIRKTGSNQKVYPKGGRVLDGFPVPEFTDLPTPLYAKPAREMLEDCDYQIAAIRKHGKADQGRTDALGQVVLTLLPAAREAIGLWEKRKGEIRQARAG